MFGQIFWLLGVCGPLFLPWRMAVLWGIVLVGLSLGAVAFFCPKRRLFFLLGLFGILRALLAIENFTHVQLPDQLALKHIPVTACIESSRIHAQTDSVELMVQIHPISAQASTTFRARLYAHHIQNFPLKTGMCRHLIVRLKRMRGQANFGLYNREQGYAFKRVVATGPVIRMLGPAFGSFWWRTVIAPFDQLRKRYQLRLSRMLEPFQHGAIIIRMLTGISSHQDQARMDEQLFVQTGVIHLLAISGLHIGIVFLFLRGLMLLIWSPASRLPGLLGLLGSLSFVALTGFPVSGQRALIMLLVTQYKKWRGQASLSLDSLLLALVWITFIDPFSVYTLGFWLSAMAVASLILMAQGVARYSGFIEKFKLIMLSQINISLSALPILLMRFGSFPVWGFAANLILIPVFSLCVLPASLIGLFLSTIKTSWAQFVFEQLDRIITWCIQWLSWVSHLPAFAWHFRPSLIGCLIAVSAGLLVAVRLPWFIRLFGLVAWFAALVPKIEPIPFGLARIDVLDVGQGLAVLVQTRGRTMLFDTGKRYKNFVDMGRDVINPYLQSRQIDSLDALVISHPDMDHIGGARSVLKAIPVHQIIGSHSVHFYRHPVQRCVAGQSWEWDGVRFQFLAPFKKHKAKSRNNESCLLSIRAKNGQTLMLTGDIEVEAERAILEQAPAKMLKSDVILIPHHGSRTSSSLDFLKAVSPKIGIITAGFQNAYHLPNQKIVKRYENLGIQLFNTANTGGIQFVLGVKGPIQIVGQRRTFPYAYSATCSVYDKLLHWNCIEFRDPGSSPV